MLFQMPVHTKCPITISRSWMVYALSPMAPRYSLKIFFLNSSYVPIGFIYMTIVFQRFLTWILRYFTTAILHPAMFCILYWSNNTCRLAKYLSSSSGWFLLKLGAKHSVLASKFASAAGLASIRAAACKFVAICIFVARAACPMAAIMTSII